MRAQVEGYEFVVTDQGGDDRCYFTVPHPMTAVAEYRALAVAYAKEEAERTGRTHTVRFVTTFCARRETVFTTADDGEDEE